jgi:hypothetical protein
MVQLSECLEKSIIKLTNKIVKKKNSNNTSTKPLKVIVDTNGNKKISSMSYNKKKYILTETESAVVSVYSKHLEEMF